MIHIGSIISIMPSVARDTLPVFFSRKKDGTPSDAAKAKQILAEGRQDYPSIREYLDSIDQLSFEGDGVTYESDGTVTLKYKN